jgi:hypothetical protein
VTTDAILACCYEQGYTVNRVEKIIRSAEKNRVGREPEPQGFFFMPNNSHELLNVSKLLYVLLIMELNFTELKLFLRMGAADRDSKRILIVPSPLNSNIPQQGRVRIKIGIAQCINVQQLL